MSSSLRVGIGRFTTCLLCILSAPTLANVGSGDAGSGSGDAGSGDMAAVEPSSPPQPPTSPPYRAPAPPVAPPDNVVSPSLVEYLRAGDVRMVRPSPTRETLRRRDEAYVALRIDTVVHELVEQRTPHDVDVSFAPLLRASAAEAITLLVTDHPTNRARIGQAPGVLTALVELVDNAWREGVAHDALIAHAQTDADFVAAESAAEAIWILSFSSATNHRMLMGLGAIEVLAAMVTARDVHGLRTVPRAVMWAAAALQNLAASYCDTPDGRCAWRWSQGGGTRLGIDEAQSVVVDANAARLSIGRVPRLLEALVAYACEGPAGPHDPPVGEPWPSKAAVDSRAASSVVPWAAAGALKNLALSEEVAERLLQTPRAAECLCRLARSRDWLESSKAQAALYHLHPRAADRPPGAVSGGNFACEPTDAPLPPRAGQRDEL